jgi:hypothetical protein
MNQASYEADVAQRNAEIEEQKRQLAQKKGMEEQGKIEREKQELQGYQRAAMGSSGIDSGYGSGLAILSDTAYLSEEDKKAARFNADLEAWGYGANAAQYRADAANAKSARTAALFSGITELGGEVASYRSTKKGMVDSGYTYDSKSNIPKYKRKMKTGDIQSYGNGRWG